MSLIALEDRAAEMKSRMIKQNKLQRGYAARKPGLPFDALGTIAIPNTGMKKLLGPLVYIFIGKNHETLYVGMSVNGISRPFSGSHHKAYARKKAVRTELIFCNTAEEASELEQHLIKEYRPRFNDDLPL